MASNLPTATVADLMSWRPCWNPHDVRSVTDLYEDEPWTALDVLSRRILPPSLISDADRLWVVLRPELVPEPLLHEFACRCAERALSLVKEPYPRSLEVIRVKRAWLRGEATDAQLRLARAAIAVDLLRIGCPLAYYAAYYAAAASSEDASLAVAEASRSKSANAANVAKAANAEIAWQLRELRKMLKEVA